MNVKRSSFRIRCLSMIILFQCQDCSSFQHSAQKNFQRIAFRSVSDDKTSTETTTSDNKAMAFLKKIGKVGGAANKDFALAVGIDEGGGKSSESGSVRAKVDASYGYSLSSF